jgi:hypothetical protein
MTDINMSRVRSRFLIRKAECSFIADLISNVKTLLVECCPCKPPVAGKIVSNRLEYDTIAAENEVVTVTMQGFIIYLYEKAYNERYPTENLSGIEKARIYEIYDALKIPRPVL